MKCLRCGKDIIVHWMRDTGTQTMEGAMTSDMDDFDEEEYQILCPRFICGCIPGTKPLITEDDMADIRASEIDEYADEFEVRRGGNL